MSRVLEELAVVLEQRKAADPDSSYVASLYAKGLDGILKKIGEEATETVIAGKAGTNVRSSTKLRTCGFIRWYCWRIKVWVRMMFLKNWAADSVCPLEEKASRNK